MLPANDRLNSMPGSVPSLSRIDELAQLLWNNPRQFTLFMDSITPSCPIRENVKSVGLFFHALGIGGGERVTRLLASLFIQIGLKVTVFTNVPPTDSSFVSSLPENTQLIVLPNSQTITPDQYHVRATQFLNALVENQIDALVFFHWFFATLPLETYLSKCVGVSTHLYVQSSFPLLFLDHDLPTRYCDIPFCYKHIDNLICLNEMDRQFWSNFNHDVRLTYNPVTLNPVDVAPSKLQGHTVIWPARLHRDKCPQKVIPIMTELIKLVPDAKLLMVGPVDSDFRAQFLEELKLAKLESAVEIVGPQPESEMTRWYAKADAFLLTSQREGWSLALGEALAMGLPAVIYELSYLTLAQCDAVISVPQNDSLGAANALAKLLLNKDESRSRASVGRKYMMHIASYDYASFWNSCFLDARTKVASNNRNPLNDMMWRELFEAYWSHIEAGEGREAQLNNSLATQNDLFDERISEIEQQHRLELDQLKNHYEQSISLKLGRLITYIPRKFKKVVRTIRTRVHILR